MNRIFFIVAVFGLCLATISSQAQNDILQYGFKNPPAAAKPRTWWHWVNGNVSKEGITSDLKAMKRVGIQEAQLFNVDLGYPEGLATYLSAKWLDLFHFAVLETKRLGLEIGFHNGAGWSSSGGPWVTPEYAMQTVIFSEVKVKGEGVFHQKLAQPATKFNYYKDIAVVAFRTPSGSQRIDELSLKALSGNAFRTHMDPEGKQVETSSLVRRVDVVDLSAKMSADGILCWKAPVGDWTILRFGHTPNGTENHPAGKGGRGLECDKMSRSAVDAYWAGGVKPILDKLGPLVGPSLTNCLIDSYEVGCNNWTTGFGEKFRKRRGYDIFTFLPALAGYYIESAEVTERFLWDFRKTVSDLIVDNYYGHFAELCHKSGMRFSVEPYGGPFESMKAGAKGDVVMGEFWIGNKLFLESPRLAASISHLKGNSLELDLGTVGVIAEVIINGRNLGVIWKAPFRVDLGNALHKGNNQLEVRVTNLWPNRLIGDAWLPDDVKWKNDRPEVWPGWLDKPADRDSKRITFTSHKFWDENSHLTLSGLLGPVVLRSYRHVTLGE